MNKKNGTQLENAYVAAHQIKSPVASLHTILQTMLGGFAGELSQQQKHLLQGADKKCYEALDTIQGLLSLKRVQEQSTTGEEITDLAAVLHSLHSKFADSAAEKGIEFRFEQKAEHAYTALEENLLREAFSALLHNAIKYTPESGRIALHLWVSEQKDEVLVKIADSGIGVPPEEHQKLFTPFFRASNAKKQEPEGTGLGLAFVKAVIEGGGGSISAGESELGGTEFSLSLPKKAAPEKTEKDDTQEPSMRVVVIGGVAAGPKIAAKIKRLDPNADVTIVEKGRILSYAGCGLPFYISGVVDDQKELISTPEGVLKGLDYFQRVKNVNVLNQTEAVEIDRANKKVRVKKLISGEEQWLPYDKLALATGAIPKMLDVPGATLQNIFTLHGFEHAEGLKEHMAEKRAKDVVIVGGGLIGVEMTESLVSAGARVTLIEMESHILPNLLDPDMSNLVQRHFETQGVRVLTGTRVTGFTGNGKVETVKTGGRELPADMVIIGTGVRANTGLAKAAGLEIGASGGLKTDSHMCTSDPDIYAAGDCVETRFLITDKPTYLPLGSTANKQGRIAAENICGGQSHFPGIVRTSICKVFDYTVANAGLTEQRASEEGYETIFSITPGLDRSHFMPGANMLIIKLLAEAKTGRILGIQAVGPGEIAKRVDVAVVALTAKMSADQVSSLDLCYAPSYSEALDNLHVAANVLKNKIDGYMEGIHPVEVRKKLDEGKDILLLDVRTYSEFNEARIEESLHIPINALRGRISELPAGKEIIVLSRVSLSAYEASIILKANGFKDVKVMDGGITMWPTSRISK